MMALRRLETITHTTTGREARVYRDAEWQEWRVRFYQDGQHLAEAAPTCLYKVLRLTPYCLATSVA